MAVRAEEKRDGHRSKNTGSSVKLLVVLGLALVGGVLIRGQGDTKKQDVKLDELEEWHAEGELCGGIQPLSPGFNKSLEMILHDAEYKKQSIERLSQAVQIPTEIWDVNPAPAENPEYYARFYEYHEYLKRTFPLIHENLKLEKVNELGLLYTWEGSEPELKPVLFMAHQDVVPVNKKTWDSWEYPPFSGHYDEKTDLIWGRGSNDCKNLMIAELEAVEQLLSDGYQPKRSVLLSFGFDEESSGPLGARYLSAFLEDRYGKDSMFSILDEGFGVVPLDGGLHVACPINAEKGYVDVEFSIHGKGGHSSVPPDHTTIGVASDLITLLESNPFKSNFQVDSPLFGMLTCVAEHSELLPKQLRKHILSAPKSSESKKVVGDFLSNHKLFRDLIRTTRAVDIFKGGIKANALPEVSTFLANHRIDIHSSVAETVAADVAYAKQIADKYGYGLFYNGSFSVPETELGYIEINVEKSLEPAPVSPSSGPVWDILAGTIQDVFQNGVFAGRDDVQLYISTTMMSGNTDTRYYWNLTKNIYRFVGSILDASSLKTIHSVNESILADSHLSAIAFIYEYIVNVDENGQ